jgi:hypothetical protein
MKVLLIAKEDFLRKIGVHFLVLQDPINKFSALHMVCWLEFLRQLNLVSMQMEIFRQNSLHGPIVNDGESMFLDSATVSLAAAMLSRNRPER